MDAIEQIVRFRLSQREKQKFLEYVRRHPEFKNKIDEALQQYKINFKDGLLDAIVEYCFPRESWDRAAAREILETSFGPYIDQISDMLCGSFSYEKLVENIGQTYMENYEMRKEEIERIFNKLEKEKKKGNKALSVLNEYVLKSLMEEVNNYDKVNDIIIARLSEIARQNSIDEALREEKIYATIRELFPTKQLYMEHLELGRKIRIRSLIQLGQALDFRKLLEPKDEEEENVIKLFNKIFGQLFIGLKPIVDILSEAYKEIQQEEIDKIYNSSKGD
jgi:hypothetical protein